MSKAKAERKLSRVRWSDDEEEPNRRIRVEIGDGQVLIVEEVMSSQSPNAQRVGAANVMPLLYAEAAWLREVLCGVSFERLEEV